MPKFVPVVDTEKPIAEQRQDKSFDKHRHFDNPHKVDRGWQQGNVGWGVLGEFGSTDRDSAAQVVKRAEGSAKMVKNERGLWVKAKELGEDVPVMDKPGRGRGGGVSVLAELASRNMPSESHEQRQEHPRQFDDLDGKSQSSKRASRDDSRDRDNDRSSRRSKSPDRRRSDRDSRERDRHDRHRGRDGDRDKDRRRDDSYRGRDRDARRSRSRSRSPSSGRDSRRRHADRRSRDRSDRDSRRRDSDGRDDSRDRDRRGSRHSPHSDRRRDEKSDQQSRREDGDRSARDDRTNSKSVEKATELEKDATDELPADFLASITAVQVINRFHEVFTHDTLFQSQRLGDIAQLFAPGAVVASLKTGAVHLTGAEAIKESFAKTMAAPVTISKRVYFERTPPAIAAGEASTGGGNGDAGEEGEEVESRHAVATRGAPVTYCLDFHRPGTAPGLGDKAKHTVLLYRCQAAHISHIYGMVDHEQLSAPEDMGKSQVLKSKVWALVRPIVQKDWEKLDEESEAHFHNYDRMEVWGMF